MQIQSVIPLYHNELSKEQIRVVEWKASKDETTHKVYYQSREYTIRIYDRHGEEKEHKKQVGNRVDVHA